MPGDYELAPEPQPRPTAGHTPAGWAAQPSAFGAPGAPVLQYARPGLELPKPNGGRARVAVFFLLALAVLDLLYVGIDLWDYFLLNATAAGTLTEEQSSRFVLVAILWAFCYAIAALTFLISFLMWLYRAVRNVRITSGGSRSGPGMSVGWWFIPIGNLVMPWLVLRDLWARTVATAVPLVGIFWLLWLGSSLAEHIGSTIYDSGLEKEDYDLAKRTIFVTSCASVASAASFALLAHIVRRVQAVQVKSEVTRS